jgi:hypothetical protein
MMIHSFEVQADVHTTNSTMFELLFANEFVCLSLDHAPSSCWPLAQSQRRPFFLGLEDGMHTLIAAVTHPYTGAPIPVRLLP